MRNIKVKAEKIQVDMMPDSWFIDQLKERGWLVGSQLDKSITLVKPGYDPEGYGQKIIDAGWELYIELKAWTIQVIIYKHVNGERVYKNFVGDLDKRSLCAMLKDIYENLEDTSTLIKGVSD